jgi:hypothetical protein
LVEFHVVDVVMSLETLTLAAEAIPAAAVMPIRASTNFLFIIITPVLEV